MSHYQDEIWRWVALDPLGAITIGTAALIDIAYSLLEIVGILKKLGL